MTQSGMVTFLFTDLVSSTEHLQRAGDDFGHELFRAHHKFMKEAVVAAGGEELQWLGDGILAAFASAADAVRCAIQVQHTARRPHASVRFDIRIGINTGEALRREDGYFGTPVVIARRLCDRAQAGQILASRLVADLLATRHGFTFSDLGALELKGIAQPVPACEVVYERNDPASMLNRTPFVGRATPMKRLMSKLDIAINGKGAVAMLLGEPGIGKTRLLEEFAELARERGAVVLRGACYDGEFQPPYGPFAEAIVNYALNVAPESLRAILGDGAPTIARIAPALLRMLGDLPDPPPLDKDEERFRLLDGVAQSLIALARSKPLVLMLDDLHWADRGTVAMLSHVAHFVPPSPILLIGAYRDGEVGRSHPLATTLAALRRIREFDSIALKGLARDEVGELLGIVGDADAPEGLVKTIAAETDGNPFFIREVLLHLTEEGKILRDGQGWTSRISIDELGIPEGVRDIIARRIMRLSDDARRLLTVGAAFKGAFSFDVAASVANLDEDAALTAADEALDAQLLKPGNDSETFDFSHALIRHALYAELNPTRRVRLHRQIAEAMERQWGERASEHAAEVAYQFWRGAAVSGAARGVDYAIAAADNAEKAYAHDESVAFLRIAIELLPANDPRRRELLKRLGLALPWTLDADEAVKIGREAAELIAATDGAVSTAEYCEQVARALFDAGLLKGSWTMAAEGLRHISDRSSITWVSLAELDRLREEADDPDNPGIRMDTPGQREWRAAIRRFPFEQIQAHGMEPQFDSREEILRDSGAPPFALTFLAGEFRRSLVIWEAEAVDAERKGRIAFAMNSWANVGRCHVALGNFVQAQAACDRAAALSARTVGISRDLLSVYSARQDMNFALDSGLEDAIGDENLRTLLNQPSLETRWAFAAMCSTAACVCARLGRQEVALQFLTRVSRALEVGSPSFGVYGIAAGNAAYALWILNRTDYVETIERCTREKIIVPDFRGPMRDGRLSLARLCALQNRYDEALEWFAKARAVLDEQGARPLRAITDFDEALMYIRRGEEGDKSRAMNLLAEADHSFRELSMTGWQQRAAENARQLRAA